MSRLYDTIAPSVIDEDILKKVVEEQGPKDEAGRIAKQEGIDFNDVKVLRLDFQNILQIDNLWCFTSLTKLQLDNNIIEKIENLDCLTNLVWLDLSFNNIEIIEGLDELIHLEDLTLFNNRITHVEGLDALSKLHVLSLGNNQIEDLENLKYLRQCVRLRTLCMAGNPVCSDAEYRPVVLAFLDQLDYLDYRLIDDDAREHAKAKYYVGLGELKHAETTLGRTRAEEEKRAEELKLHTLAFVENLDSDDLFQQMYAEDPEGQKLNLIPGVDDVLEKYKEKFAAACQKIFERGLQEHNVRKNEVDEFWACLNEAKEANKAFGMQKIADFIEYRKKFSAEIGTLVEPKVQETRVKQYLRNITQLRDDLMRNEMQLVDQLEDNIKEFERNIVDMNGSFLETVQGQMNQLRELQNLHNERILELAMTTLEKVLKGEIDEESLPEELRSQIFVDKDSVENAVQQSHDAHMVKIDNREDEISTRIKNWEKNLMLKIQEEEEIERNRKRVQEINHFYDYLNEEAESQYFGNINL